MNKLLSALSTHIFTWFHGECVGVDSFGNRYYRQRNGKTSPIGFGRERRWVVYANEIEASLVPPEWHGWLHHSHFHAT